MQIHKRKYTNTVLHADRVTHAARYMRLTKGDKVKHMFVSLGAMHFGEGHMPIVYRSRPLLLRNQIFYHLHTCSKWNNTWPSLFSYNIWTTLYRIWHDPGMILRLDLKFWIFCKELEKKLSHFLQIQTVANSAEVDIREETTLLKKKTSQECETALTSQY